MMGKETNKYTPAKDPNRPFYTDYLGENERDLVLGFVFLISVFMVIYGLIFYYFPKPMGFVTVVVLFAIVANKYKDPVLTKKEILEQAGVKLDQE